MRRVRWAGERLSRFQCHGVWTVLLLLYPHTVATSILVLVCPRIPHENGTFSIVSSEHTSSEKLVQHFVSSDKRFVSMHHEISKFYELCIGGINEHKNHYSTGFI